MIEDNQLELLTWGSNTGPAIGGVAPDVYNTRLHPVAPPIREFHISSHKPKPGEQYADVLYFVHRTILTNTGKLSLLFDLIVDENVALNAQALEFDTKLAANGFMYNFSSQFNYNTGIWQISDVNGNWINTGYKFVKLTPGVPYSIRFDYQFGNKLYRFVGASGVDFTITAPLPGNIVALPTTWANSCNLQVQQDLNANGGMYSTYLRNVKYIWS